MKKIFLLFSLLSFLSSFEVTFAYTSSELTNADYLASKKIIKHWDTPENYRLGDTIVRSEIMGMALAMVGITRNTNCRGDFVDVVKSQTDWVCRTIETAADHRFINAQNDLPKNNRKARPYDSITRAEALAILAKIQGTYGVPPEGSTFFGANAWQSNLLSSLQALFPEIFKNIPSKIRSGCEMEPCKEYYFRPNEDATRAEVFGFAYDILQKISSIVGNGYSFSLPTGFVDFPGGSDDFRGDSASRRYVSNVTGDVIITKELHNVSSYTDSDGKFGDMTISYNSQKKGWEVVKKECDIGKCGQTFYTTSGIQVFFGTGAWLTYIIPISNNSILTFNTTSENTKPLEEFIQTLKIAQ